MFRGAEIPHSLDYKPFQIIQKPPLLPSFALKSGFDAKGAIDSDLLRSENRVGLQHTFLAAGVEPERAFGASN